jgi:regulator of RNase E activity RraA
MSNLLGASFAGVCTATLATQLARRGIGSVYMQGVRPLSTTKRLVGPAFTLRFIPAREDIDRADVKPDPNEVMREAIETTPPGHVLVMDCRRETRASAGGGLLFARLAAKGVAGVVSDGCVRAADLVAGLDLPVFCAGASAPVSRGLHHPLEYGRPIACGEVAVYPGDFIVADSDGVIVIPAALVEEVARDAIEQEALEEFLLQRLRHGAPLKGTYPPDHATRLAFACKRENPTSASPGSSGCD